MSEFKKVGSVLDDVMYGLTHKIKKPELYDEYLALAYGNPEEKKKQRILNEIRMQKDGRLLFEDRPQSWLSEKNALKMNLVKIDKDDESVTILDANKIRAQRQGRYGKLEFLFCADTKYYSLLKLGDRDVLMEGSRMVGRIGKKTFFKVVEKEIYGKVLKYLKPIDEFEYDKSKY